MDTRKFVEAIREAGFVARSYSGRCMHGAKCVGVEIEEGQSAFDLGVKVAAAYIGGDNDGGAEEIFDLRASEDSMGRGGIVYFPRVQWSDDLADGADAEEDDDDCEYARQA